MLCNKINWFLASTCIMTILLVGCGHNEAKTTSQEALQTQQQVDNTTEPRTLTDALGNRVEVPVHPKRVIASYLEDHLVALGITPVAQWSVRDGTSVQDYLQDVLQEVPTIPYDLPFEAVQSFQPDLIIMDSAAMVEGDKYAQYSNIAPTFVIGTEVNNDWRDELLAVGEVFGQKDKAQQVLDVYNAKVKEAQQRLYHHVGNSSAAAVWVVGGKFFIVSQNLSSGDVMYNDLGLTVPAVVQEISANATANWNEISLEKLVTLDADHLFVIESADDESVQALSEKLWQAIPAVQAGNVHKLPKNSSWLYTGAIANTKIVDDIVNALAK
ncbi:ABC transporter substrate-binding protein [Lysinibacillus sp. NPDC097195]|uniref:ABC transporter substrate-binding protein n=1 Tax=Lysinibacillus sp. NPDC097195 TaxID=3364141 RepID=UPI003807B1E8